MDYSAPSLETLQQEFPNSALDIKQGAMSKRAFIDLGVLAGASRTFASQPFMVLLRHSITPENGFDPGHQDFYLLS